MSAALKKLVECHELPYRGSGLKTHQPLSQCQLHVNPGTMELATNTVHLQFSEGSEQILVPVGIVFYQLNTKAHTNKKVLLDCLVRQLKWVRWHTQAAPAEGALAL